MCTWSPLSSCASPPECAPQAACLSAEGSAASRALERRPDLVAQLLCDFISTCFSSVGATGAGGGVEPAALMYE